MKKIIIFLFSIITSIAWAQDVKISAMPTATDLTGSTFIPIIQNGANKKAPPNLFGAIGTLIPTAVKTANYTAAAFDFVPCDITTGSFTVTLPTAPADNTVIGVKIIAALGPNTLTIACGGSNVFNATGGSTKIVLTSRYQAVTLQYNASLGVWYVVNTDNKSVIDFYPDLSSTTLTATALSYGRAESGIVIVGNWAFIIGGANNYRGQTHPNITNNQVWRAPVSNMTSWTQLANGPFQQRGRFGCVSTGPNKILVYGQDPYDCGGANCNQYRDAWLGTVNPSTGAVTWTLKNAAMPMSDRFWYASFAHKGCAYMAGGICDDWPAPPTHQCAQKSTELWKSCDDGVTWSKVSQNNLWGRNNFDPADTVYGRQVYGNGISFNNKIYMIGGGTVASNIYQRYTFDSAIWVSPDDGVTFSMIKSKLQKGVTSPAITVADNRLYVLFGTKYSSGAVAGVVTQLIQYLDTTNAVHQVYTSIPQRSDAVAATVTVNGITKIITGLGYDPTITDTTKVYLNDLYLLDFSKDNKLVYGDVANLRTLTVDDSTFTNYVNPTSVNGILTLDKFINIQRLSKTNFTLGAGTLVPNSKFAFQGVNWYVGANAGAGGGNRYESSTLTTNAEKFWRIEAPSYTGNNDYVGLFGYDSPSGAARVLYIGGDAGIGTQAYPTKVQIGINTLAPAVQIVPTLTTFYNPVSLVAGAAAAGKAPLYIPSGTNLSTAEAGALENNGTHLYFTFANSGTRYQLDQQAGGGGNPFDDGTAIIKGSADATKLLRFEVDGFTTGTTRVLTTPNFNGIIATTNNAQTITGVQTFSSLPTIPATPSASTDAASKGYVDGLTLGPFSTVAAGYTNLSGAAGSLLKGDNSWLAIGASRKMLVSNGSAPVYSTETWAVPGTSGNVLTSNGTDWTSAAPTGGGGTTLTPTAVKTTTYTAVVGDLVIASTASSSWTLTLPTAPADKSIIGVKLVAVTGTNALIVATGGSDVFNIAFGGAALTSSQIDWSVTLQYKSSNGVWYVGNGDPGFTSLFATLIGTETLTNKTLTAPKFANTGFIADNNGNAQITFNTVASAVNNLSVFNAATGGTPAIGVSGTDTNIPLSIQTKGTGLLNIYGNSMTIGGAGYGSGSVGPISITGNSSSGSGQAGSDIVLKTGQGAAGNANSGSIYLDADVKAGSGKVGSVSFFKTTADFGGGEKVIYMGNATTNPTTNPTGGGLMFVKSADNKPYWRTPAGVETVMLGGAAGGSVFSSLSASVATNTIDNLNYANEWQWSTLAGITGLKISSASTAAASNAQRLFEVNLSGANATSTQTTTAGYFINTHTGTASTNQALYVEASGGTTNYAIEAKGDIESTSTNSVIRMHNSFTDANNYDRVEMGNTYWDTHSIGRDSKASGTRVGGSFTIFSSGTSGYLEFGTGSAAVGRLMNAGYWRPATDNTYDWGEVGGNAFRAIYTNTMRVGAGAVAPTSTLNITGSFAPTITSTSTDLTLTSAHYTVKVDASGANRTITLPASSGISGRVYIIKKTDSSGNTVTIDGNASETIDGATTKVINTQWAGYVIQSDNTNWVIISTF